jgi:hypothetical protein
MKALMDDEKIPLLDLPFEGQRMIFANFLPILHRGSADGTSYRPVPNSGAGRQT